MRDLYEKVQEPISTKILQSYKGVPTRKVFERIFGSWKEACEEANVPYNRKSKVGELGINNHGYSMKIIDYNSSKDV